MKPVNKKAQKIPQNIYIKKETSKEKRTYYNNHKIKDKNYPNNKKDNESKGKIFNITKTHNPHKYKNEFISISDFQENEEHILDNNNYKTIIQNSIIKLPCNNFENIKSVDANNYLNKENNSIASFNDLKLKILNKKLSFNSPFIFCKNNSDLSSTEKIEEEKNYQMKRYRYLKNYKYSFNPSVRRKNSKIIQNWWRYQIMPKIIKREKIIKIQSVYKGYITRKHLNDIILITIIYQNFINKLRKVLSNFVRRNYFPKRYYKKEYAIRKILPLKLKTYFRRWQKFRINSEQKEKVVKNIYKNREKNRNTLLILKSFFKIWKIKCEQMKLDEKGVQLLKDKDKKYNAINKLFNDLVKIGHHKAFSLSKNNLKKYLTHLFKKKCAEKLLKLYKRYKLERNIKRYFEKWKNYISKEKENTLKELTKSNLKNIQDLLRAKNNLLFLQGLKYITNGIRKNIFSQIFRKYLNRINLGKKLLKIITNLTKKFYLKK